jgi:TonB family protein
MHYLPLLFMAAVLCGCSSSKEPRYAVAGEAPLSREAAEKAFAQRPPKSAVGQPLDGPLKVIAAPFPEYPAGFRNDSNTGSVRVKFFIEKDGTVSNPSIFGSPPPALAAISLNAILRWRFEPPMSDGKFVRIGAEQEFVFKLE